MKCLFKLNFDKYILLNLLTYAIAISVISQGKMMNLLSMEPCDFILVNREALLPFQGSTVNCLNKYLTLFVHLRSTL